MNDFIITLMLMGALSSGPSLPFWMTANRYGMMPESNGGLALARIETGFDPAKQLQWRWGASLAANYDSGTPAQAVVLNGTKDLSLMVDELYGSLRWKVLSADIGIKHQEIEYVPFSWDMGSLSTTGGHLAWSGNSRSMPGYTAHLDPIAVPFTGKHVWFYGLFGDYRTLDTRVMSGALVHRTKAMIRINITERLDFEGALDHYAFWGGESETNSIPVTFGNYFRVITGRGASSAGSKNDQINVIGDQRGSEIIRLAWRGDGWKASVQHDIPYDDGSGMGFQNFPDGVNTLWFGFDDKNRWVSDILYEYQYTMFQSGTRHDRPTTDEEKQHLDPSDEYHYNRHIIGGGDNYFNNGEYRSGWTYFGHTIGNPLFFPMGTHNGTWTGKGMVLGVENNRLRAHHLGIAGKLFRKAPYKLMLTYSKDYGIYSTPYTGESQWNKDWKSVRETPLRQVSGAFMGEVPFKSLALTYGFFADRGELLPDTVGATLGVKFTFRPR